MNSRQRRKQKRKFNHEVTVSLVPPYSTMIDVLSMLEWCHVNYGKHGYVYSCDDTIRFSFPSVNRAVEFKLRWADA